MYNYGLLIRVKKRDGRAARKLRGAELAFEEGFGTSLDGVCRLCINASALCTSAGSSVASRVAVIARFRDTELMSCRWRITILPLTRNEIS